MAIKTNAHGGQVSSSGSGMRGEDQFIRDQYDKLLEQQGGR